jgi:hypothetical protein
MDPNAQSVLDDAVREAAEDLDVSPRAFRPILSCLIDRAARAWCSAFRRRNPKRRRSPRRRS